MDKITQVADALQALREAQDVIYDLASLDGRIQEIITDDLEAIINKVIVLTNL